MAGKVDHNPHISLDAKLVPVDFRQYAYADNMREGATSEALSKLRELTATLRFKSTIDVKSCHRPLV